MQDIYQQEWVSSQPAPPLLGSGDAVVPRVVCGGCGGGRLHQFLDLGASPLADRFPPAGGGGVEAWVPLGAAVCLDCWLAQLTQIVPDADLFGEGYGFCTGSSPSAVAYFARYAQWALGRFGDQARRLTVEIGCNDGTLLKEFAAAGCPVAGVDPAQPAAGLARAAGLDVVAEPFTWEVARRIRAQRGAAGLVVANNVAAHVADPLSFLAALRSLLAPDGVALVEFQYLPRLLAGGQFDHVYHEHRFFWTLDSFALAAARVGLPVMGFERVAAQGGSLRVILGWGTPDPAVAASREAEGWLRTLGAYSGAQGRAEFCRAELLSMLRALADDGVSVAGWGASAKSCTLLNFCGIGPDLISHVVDTTEGKIGRVTPGSRIPVVAPGERPDPGVYLLLAWNYLGGMLRRERGFLEWGGRVIVPVPVPVIL